MTTLPINSSKEQVDEARPHPALTEHYDDLETNYKVDSNNIALIVCLYCIHATKQNVVVHK